MTQRTVVILLSDKRSGSTIFQHELCKHRDVQTVKYSPHTYRETQHWIKGACLLEMPEQTFYGHKLPSAFSSHFNSRTLLEDELRGNLPDWSIPDDDRELVFGGWESLCDRFAQPIFFEKSPQRIAQWGALLLMLEWMKTTEYRVKIIGLVRNPLSVMYSAGQLFHSNPERRQHGWADMHKNLLSFRAMVDEDQFHMLRYEEMIADPVNTFSTICDFIGIDRDPELGDSVHVESRNKWLTDQSFGLQLHSSVSQMARHFGYSDDELTNPPKSGTPKMEIACSAVQRQLVRLRSRLFHGIVKPLLLWRGKNR